MVKGKPRLFYYAPARRDTVVTVLRDVFDSAPDALSAYLHRSFISGGPFRHVDVSVYLDGGWEEATGPRASDLSAEVEAVLRRELGEDAARVDVRVLNEAHWVSVTRRYAPVSSWRTATTSFESRGRRGSWGVIWTSSPSGTRSSRRRWRVDAEPRSNPSVFRRHPAVLGAAAGDP